jgi:hypothetical protein
VPPPGTPHLVRVHRQFLRTQQAPEHDHRPFALRTSSSPWPASAQRVSLPACPQR